jgi:hypothetical protein
VREDSDDDSDEWEERGTALSSTRFSSRGRGGEQQHRDSVIPPVPERYQADLLSVGMRVRKSVPEGYKTHKTATLPSIQTTLSKGGPVATLNGDAYSVKPPREAVPDVLQHQRELLPFCGLLKIGGFAEQPVTNVHLYSGVDDRGDKPINLFPLPAEAFNQPFSSSTLSTSQDSLSTTFSTDSLPPSLMNPQKRSWQDEDPTAAIKMSTNFLFALPMKVSEDEVPVSPLSATPSQSLNVTSMPSQSALRPFAQPRTRRQQPGPRMVQLNGAIFQEADIDMDVENAEQSGERANDFGEADFLRPWATREVEMGGV